MAADPNDPDLLAVATAYRNGRIAGETDGAAYVGAVAAYRKRHPDLSDDEVVNAAHAGCERTTIALQWPIGGTRVRGT